MEDKTDEPLEGCTAFVGKAWSESGFRRWFVDAPAEAAAQISITNNITTLSMAIGSLQESSAQPCGDAVSQASPGEYMDLPERIVYRSVGSEHLFIAPAGPTWISPDDLGALLLVAIREGCSTEESVRIVVTATGRPWAHVRSAMQALQEQIERQGFTRTLPLRGPAPDPIPFLHLYLSRNCNLRCIHCYMAAGKSMENELTGAEQREVIKQFTEHFGQGVVVASGGEPLMRKDWSKTLAFVRSQGHRVVLLTNGTLIRDRETVLKLRNLVDALKLSVDGATEASCDRIRGAGTFSKLLRAIELLKAEQMPIYLTYTFMVQNAEDLGANLMTFLHSLDYDQLNVSLDDKVELLGRAAEKPSSEFLAPSSTRNIIKRLVAELAQAGWYHEEGHRNHGEHHCPIGQGLTVDAIGDIYPCFFPTHRMGNSKRCDWNEVVPRIKRLHTETAVANIPLCRYCEVRAVCIGQCRMRNHLRTGDMMSPVCDNDWRESLYRRMIDNFL